MQSQISLAPNYEGAITSAANHYQLIAQFVRSQLREGTDYGVIPHTNSKPVLLKAGAEKLCRLFSLRAQFELIDSVADFNQPLFYYHYRCSLYRRGELVGQGDGTCNGWEYKFKKQNRPFDLANTICKMGQKRALIAAVLVCCGVSEFFTQDLESDDRE
jgi:hypothetical protein